MNEVFSRARHSHIEAVLISEEHPLNCASDPPLLPEKVVDFFIQSEHSRVLKALFKQIGLLKVWDPVDAKFLSFPRTVLSCFNQNIVARDSLGELDVFEEEEIDCVCGRDRRTLKLVAGFNGSGETKVSYNTGKGDR